MERSPAAGTSVHADYSSGSDQQSESIEEGSGVEGKRRKGKGPRKRLSEVLSEIASDASREKITLAELMGLMEGRARAALIFVFAFPNVLPAPPGVSAILGMPLLYLTSQMMMGRIPWLPRQISQRGVSMTSFAALIDRIHPPLTRAERMFRPRWSLLVSHSAERSLGALAFLLSVVVTLPIPLGNILPAFAVCLIALGVLERDGIWASVGAVIGLAALALSGTVAYAMIKTMWSTVVGAFS